MAKYRVHFMTTASTMIEVDVPDSVTEPDDIAEYAFQENFPTLCHQCSGGMFGRPELDLGEWEPVLENGKPLIETD